jgi:hypothetical protein
MISMRVPQGSVMYVMVLPSGAEQPLIAFVPETGLTDGYETVTALFIQSRHEPCVNQGRVASFCDLTRYDDGWTAPASCLAGLPPKISRGSTPS